MRSLVLAVALLLPGCLAAEEEPAPASTTPPGGTPPGPRGNATAPVEVLRNETIAWDGSVGRYAGACAEGAGCRSYQMGDDRSELLLEGLSGTVRSVHLTLAWTSSGPTTANLGFGAMIMYPDCDDCEHPTLGEAMGGSPLVIAAEGLNVTIERGGVLHLYVWPREGFRAVGPAFVVASLADDPFRVDGVVALGAPAPDA